MTNDDLVKSDSFGLLPLPAARLFGSPAQVLSQTTQVDETAAAA